MKGSLSLLGNIKYEGLIIILIMKGSLSLLIIRSAM